MQGHIRKRGKKFAFVIELDRDPATGKRRQKWVSGFATKEAAEKALRKKLTLVDEGKDAFPAEIALRDYVVEHWLPHLVSIGELRPGTIRNYRQITRDHVLPRLGALELRKVKVAHVQAVLDAMTASGRSPRTVGHARAAMSSAFAQAIRWELMQENPVRASRAPKKEKPDLRVPSANELRLLAQAARGTVWELPVLLSTSTGARRGEVLGLRWGNVDLDNGSLKIVEAVQRIDHKLVYTEPKTKQGKREIGLRRDVVDRLRQHRREQAERLLALGVGVTNEHPVCDRGDGTPLDPSTFTHALSRLAEGIGLKGVRLHDLRHGLAVSLVESGESIALTSRLLGHAKVSFTWDVYCSHADAQETQRQVGALERANGAG